MCRNVAGGDTNSTKYDVMQDERVDEQIQRLLDARDQEAFSRLLIDSVCSMPADDFRRVREKLIRKFVDDKRRTTGDVWPDDMTVKTESAADGRPDDVRQSDDDATIADARRSSLSLKIVNVRSCSVEETDGSWSSTGDRPPLKREPPDSGASCRGGRVADGGVDDLTTTNYITIMPIETTANSDGETAVIESRDDGQVQRQRVDVTRVSPASAAARRREPGQVAFSIQAATEN